MELAQNIYEYLGESYYNHNCFFPNILKQGIFTIMIKDNFDINARSTFVMSHYHGTNLYKKNMVCQVNKARIIPKKSPLPAEYVNIKKLFTLPEIPDKCLWAPLC